jgi:hypothetical protein
VTAGLPRPGAPLPRAQTVVVPSRNVAEVRSAPAPAEFEQAVRSLRSAVLRAEVRVEEMRPPQRLAPWTHALALEVQHNREVIATGRLVLLYDPQGHPAWRGTFRLVGYASVDLESELARDPLLPEVCWSWLVDALAGNEAGYVAAGGTVTQTSSTRFGEVVGADPAGPAAGGDPTAASASELEVRVSWTPLDPDLSRHLRAWADLLCAAAGLPPPGVAVLPGRPEP